MLNIDKDINGCFANPIGFDSPNRYHKLNLNGFGCFCAGTRTPLHELLHSLGFWHEHQRPDRDEYIKMNWTNIWTNVLAGRLDPQVLTQFNKHQWSTEKPPNEEKCNYQDPSTFDYCFSGSTVKNFGLEYDFKSIMHYWDSQ